MIVDPSNFCSDPITVTGSYDWTAAANTLNDENILIIHDGTISNEYYQSIRANFAALGDTLNKISNCSLAHVTGPALNFMEDGNSLLVHPNPATNTTNISYNLSGSVKVSLSIYNIIGQEVLKVVSNTFQDQGQYTYPVNVAEPGIYFVKFTIGELSFTRKFVKL
jgi:hypothetical protein